jgi:hypothetical protein
MYRAFVEVVPEASNFTGALTGQVTAASAAAGAAGGKAAAGGLLAGFGKAVPLIGAGIAALGIGDLIGDALSDGANYEQAFGAVEDVFEDASDAIVRFSKTSAKQLGLSATQALVGAKDFGIFGRAAGLTGDDLAAFSTDLLALGSDLAAFGNTSPEEAVTALSAGLRGESEPLRRYGVLLDDAKLRAKALELGIYDGNGALNSQQKILAAQAEIFAQTGIQQGQFARESDTLAAKQAILAASWEDISTRIGTAFLPVAQDLVDMLIRDLVPALEDFAEWLNQPDTQQGIKQFGEGVREAGNFLRDYFFVPLSDTFGLISGLVGFLNGGISFEDFKSKMTELPGFWGMLFRAAEDAGTRIGATVGTMIWHVKQFAGEVGTNIGNVVSWFGSLPGRVADAVRGIGGWLYNSGKALIQGFIDGINAMFAPIGRAVGGVLDFVAGFFPHSPAEHGPFSGSGWTALGNSGVAIANQFAAGLESQYRQLQAAAGGLMQAATPVEASMGRPVQVDVHAGPGMSAETVGLIAADRLNYVLRGKDA